MRRWQHLAAGDATRQRQTVSLRHLRSEENLEHAGPREIAVVARLHLLADADKALFECVLAAGVDHLLFYRCILWAPAKRRRTDSCEKSKRDKSCEITARSHLAKNNTISDLESN